MLVGLTYDVSLCPVCGSDFMFGGDFDVVGFALDVKSNKGLSTEFLDEAMQALKSKSDESPYALRQ